MVLIPDQPTPPAERTPEQLRRIEARDLMERHGIAYDARALGTVAAVLEALAKEGRS